MLEARLLVKLAQAKSMWETPPYYTNDAQDVIKEAIAMAVDTEWEDRLDMILKPECHLTFDELRAQFLREHPKTTESEMDDITNPINMEFHKVCQDADKQYSDHVIDWLGGLINSLCTTMGDKVHRRNLQIADLKREPERMEARIKRATSEVNQLLGDIDGRNLEMFQVKERIGKINLALLK